MDNSNQDPSSILATASAINTYLAFILRYKPQSSASQARFWTGSGRFFARYQDRLETLIGKGEALLQKLYDGRQDVRNQQYLELQINKHKFAYVLHHDKPEPSLRTIATIARGQANHRIHSQCREAMIYTQAITEDFLFWSAPIRFSSTCSGLCDIFATHDALELVELLLHFDRTLTNATSNERPSLILTKAVSIGIFEPVKLMLELGFLPNATGEQGRTALHLAAYHGHERIARLILDHDATCSSLTDGNGLLPLHVASENGRKSLVELLMKLGESHIRQKSTKGLTSLHLAASNGHEAIVTSLLDHGANVEEGDQDGWTSLHWASSRWHYGVVYLLLQHGADVNSKTNDGTTPIDLAARCGHRAMVSLLLANHADLHTPSEGHTTALHFAAKNSDADLVRLLLEKGATTLSKDGRGKSALHFAAKNSDADLVRLLLEKGATTRLKDRRGNSAMHIAARTNNVDIMSLLISNDTEDPTAEGSLERVRAENNDGDTALHFAAEMGHQDIVEFLLANGADIHHQNHLRRTVFHSAVEKGHKHIIELLLRAPDGRLAADTRPGKFGETALELAKKLRHREIVVLLREDGEEESETESEAESQTGNSSSSESNSGSEEALASP
ncbi:hypothetical protein Daus18300_005960 [Diaporthe australafricana]|uniref:Ankyrin repeat protein n=1 Tax=Diaporthe australafricana TaxID=127596 RepID=A0ABR3WYK1_9PEZI